MAAASTPTRQVHVKATPHLPEPHEYDDYYEYFEAIVDALGI